MDVLMSPKMREILSSPHGRRQLREAMKNPSKVIEFHGKLYKMRMKASKQSEYKR